MTTDQDATQAIERVPTGIAGLDVVLRGGLLRAGVYLVLGNPGAGKTVLCNQVAFHHVAAGGRAVYVTLLSESHARMLAHLRNFEFFDDGAIATSLVYVSGYQVLEQESLKGLLGQIRRSVREADATLLVLDGIVASHAVPDSEILFKKFIHELKAFVEMAGCTVLLQTSMPEPGAHYPAQTMVDGILVLSTSTPGMRAVRDLEVTKFRGGGFLEGKHVFEITTQGLRIHPRVEARYQGDLTAPGPLDGRAPFGIAGLDTMLDGGLDAPSAALLIGPPGTGKTLLGLHFAAAGLDEGRCLFFGFHEGPDALVAKAAGVGLDLAGPRARGDLSLVWRAALELVADQVAEEILAEVRRRQVRRVVVDGVEVFARALARPERAHLALSALALELRRRGVTVLFTEATVGSGPGAIILPPHGLAESVDGLIALRHLERDGMLHRQIAIIKRRGGPHDHVIRDLAIRDDGVSVVVPAAGRPPRPARRTARPGRGRTPRKRR